MKYLIIVILLCDSLAWAYICCQKWNGAYGGLKNGKPTAWTNEGQRRQVEIKYCPECGKILKVKYLT